MDMIQSRMMKLSPGEQKLVVVLAVVEVLAVCALAFVGWAWISHNSLVWGAAPTAAVTVVPPTITPLPTVEPPTPEPSPTPSLTGSILVELGNIRQEPDMESAIVGQVAKDEMIVLLGRSADGAWARMITTAGTEGWVWAPLVQSTPAVKDLPEYKPQQ